MNADTSEEMVEAVFFDIYPHEGYAAFPEQFWNYFHKKFPNVSRKEMEEILKSTEDSQ